MAPHDVCVHAEDWGTVRQQIKNLEKCTEKLKEEQELTNDKVSELEKSQVTKQDFQEFKKSIQHVGMWTVVGLFAGQLLLKIIEKVVIMLWPNI